VRRRTSKDSGKELQDAPTSINPSIVPDLQAIDAIVGDLLDFYSRQSVQVIILSEYGITNVNTPIHLNRRFREKGWLAIKEELGLELLDAGASKVFAVADHQIAHIYINDPSIAPQLISFLRDVPGIDYIYEAQDKVEYGINHKRSGDLIAISKPNAWFTYYYWFDDAKAPDFARTVDIHRKPGYDPVELFLDPAIKFPLLKIASKLLKKKLGFRMLMDLIPLDATLVKGSHGYPTADPAEQPILIAPTRLAPRRIESTEVFDLIGAAVRSHSL
jgi:predicted AlkP superfamily pyrophosphatase or phosphodiesterase